MSRAVQLLQQENTVSSNDSDGPPLLLLWCCEAVSALCAGIDGRALGGHDAGLDYGYALGVDCLDDDDTASQLGGDFSGGQGQGLKGLNCRSLFKSAGLCPLLATALEMVCDCRDLGDLYAHSSVTASGIVEARIPLAATAAALCRAVGSLALANESPGSSIYNSGNDGIALAMLVGKFLFNGSGGPFLILEPLSSKVTNDLSCFLRTVAIHWSLARSSVGVFLLVSHMQAATVEHHHQWQKR